MKKVMTLALVSLLCLSVVALAGEKGKAGEKKVSGTIAKVDFDGKTLTVNGPDGKSWSLAWNDATRVLGGELKEGGKVSVGYTETDGKMWASWIKVAEPKS